MNPIDFLRILNAVDPVKTGAFMGRMAAYDNAICSAITDEQKQFVVANIGGSLDSCSRQVDKRRLPILSLHGKGRGNSKGPVAGPFFTEARPPASFGQ